MTQPSFSLVDLVFYLASAGILGCAAYAVFTRNIMRAVFSLLGTFFGVAVLYGLLAADFVAVVQVMVYVGGILVLLLFAVMLTGNIETAARSNRSAGLIIGGIAGSALVVLLVVLAVSAPWTEAIPAEFVQPVEIGVRESLERGILAGYPLIGVGVALFDEG